MIAENSTVYM